VSVLDAPRVRHESEPIVDADSAKEGFQCTGKPVHVAFHGIHPLAGASRLFGNLVKRLDPRLEHSKPLAVLGFDI
jgi:hypothetical protein